MALTMARTMARTVTRIMTRTDSICLSLSHLFRLNFAIMASLIVTLGNGGMSVIASELIVGENSTAIVTTQVAVNSNKEKLINSGAASNIANSIASRVESKKCLLVMSYHKGYEWNDGIESGVTKKLSGVCQLKKIYLDTKRNASTAFGEAAGLKAKTVVDQFQPDVLIVSDDNASRFLAEPFYKNKSLPVVFCGINWSASEYGYPYKNATGMVEVAPIIPLFKIIQRSIGIVKKGVFLSSDVLTEHKDYLRYQIEYEKRGVNLKSEFVSSMDGWKLAYLNAQQADFIIVSNKAGISDWDESEIVRFVEENGKHLTVTNYSWMMPYAILGMTKQAKEQGEWAGDVASAILSGLPVENIPVTINKTWDLFVNMNLLKRSSVSLSNRVLNRAHKSW